MKQEPVMRNTAVIKGKRLFESYFQKGLIPSDSSPFISGLLSSPNSSAKNDLSVILTFAEVPVIMLRLIVSISELSPMRFYFFLSMTIRKEPTLSMNQAS